MVATFYIIPALHPPPHPPPTHTPLEIQCAVYTHHTSQFKLATFQALKPATGTCVDTKLGSPGLQHLNAKSFIVKVMTMKHKRALAPSPPPWEFSRPYSPPEYPPQTAS